MPASKELKPCGPGKIRNPETGRCVSIDGKIGKRLQAKKLSPPKKSSVEKTPGLPNDMMHEIAKRMNSNTLLQMRQVSKDIKQLVNTSSDIKVPRGEADIKYHNLIKGIKQLIIDTDSFCDTLPPPQKSSDIWHLSFGSQLASIDLYREETGYRMMVMWDNCEATMGEVDYNFFNKDRDYIKYGRIPSSHHVTFKTQKDLLQSIDKWPTIKFEFNLQPVKQNFYGWSKFHKQPPLVSKTLKSYMISMLNYKPRNTVWLTNVVSIPSAFPRNGINILNRKIELHYYNTSGKYDYKILHPNK